MLTASTAINQQDIFMKDATDDKGDKGRHTAGECVTEGGITSSFQGRLDRSIPSMAPKIRGTGGLGQGRFGKGIECIPRDTGR